METTELLKAAAELIKEKGWVQENYAVDEWDFATHWALVTQRQTAIEAIAGYFSGSEMPPLLGDGR